MTNHCIVCTLEFNTGSQSEDNNAITNTATNPSDFSNEEFWSVFFNLFKLDSSVIPPNCIDSWNLKFCSKCKPTAVKLFNLHNQLVCIQSQLSQTIAHVSSTVLHTENSQSRSFNDDVNNNIRRGIYQRFTPRLILHNWQPKLKLVTPKRQRSSQQKNKKRSTAKTLDVVKHEPNPGALKHEDDCNSPADFSDHIEVDNCLLDENGSDSENDNDDFMNNNKRESDSDFDPEEFIPSKTLHVDKKPKVEKSENTIPRKKGLTKRRQRKLQIAERRKLLGPVDSAALQSESELVQESADTLENHPRVTEIAPGEYLYLEKFGYTREPDGYYKCQSCTIGRRKKQNDVHRHINNKHNKVRFACDKCKRHWDSQNKLDKHVCRPKLYVRQPRIRKYGDGRYSYDNEYFFVKRNELFQCDTCNETKRCLPSMTAHIIRRHAAPDRWVCEHCGASFGSKKNLSSHIVQHDDARPFLCDQCPKSFKTGGHLWCHQKSHNVPQYQCNVCEKKFKYSHGLARHRLSAGHPAPLIPETDSLFYCPKCNNAYLKQHTLNIHLKNCTGKKEFQCNECDKKFPKLSILRGHQYWNHKRLKKSTETQQQSAHATNSNVESQHSETVNIDLNENMSNNSVVQENETKVENQGQNICP